MDVVISASVGPTLRETCCARVVTVHEFIDGATPRAYLALAQVCRNLGQFKPRRASAGFTRESGGAVRLVHQFQTEERGQMKPAVDATTHQTGWWNKKFLPISV